MDMSQRKVELWTSAMAADPDLYEVAARVATIPDCAAAVIRYANSAYVGAVYPVGTVLESVIRVGCRSVGALSMASLNRELVDTWGAPQLWEESLVIGRAAKMIARMQGATRTDTEHLFVSGLFSIAGSAALMMQDDGYLQWRRGQKSRQVHDLDLLRKERMVYGVDHVSAAGRLLDEWNLPVEIITAVSAHHEPTTPLQQILTVAMSALWDDSLTRCVSVPFREAMAGLGLQDHVSFVETEARLFADITLEAFSGNMSVEQDIPAQW
jgi:HD-like signal output (HDOD) protein